MHLERIYGEDFRKFKFFDCCKLRSLDLTSVYSKIISESFVKMKNDDSYYQIRIFFKDIDKRKVLVKEIPISGVLKRKINYCQPNFYFTVDQFKKVDSNELLRENRLFVFDCEFIERKFFFQD